MLVIDHQSGSFQAVGEMPMSELHSRSFALATIDKLSNVPVIVTASIPQGLNGRKIIETLKKGRTGTCQAYRLPIVSCRVAQKAVKKDGVPGSLR